MQTLGAQISLRGVDKETNSEPQSRLATLLALTDVQHNWAEMMVCHNWK